MNKLNSFIWSITLIILIFVSIKYLFITKLLPFRMFKIFKILKKTKSEEKLYKSLFMTLAAKIGVGSIAGIALAIKIGGPGTIFWMWIITILTSVITIIEGILGTKCKVNSSSKTDAYIENKKISNVYLLLLILVYIVGFNSIQSNTIVKLTNNLFFMPNYIIGILIVIITYFIIRRKNKFIIEFISKLVPIMSIIYILMSIFIIYINVDMLPQIFTNILKEGLGFKGASVSIIIYGIQRGIFASEVGTGTCAVASSLINSKNGIKAGIVQYIGVLFTVFIICTFTGIMILMIDYKNIGFNLNGIELTSIVFNKYLGKTGIIMLLFTIVLFAFSTIISGYYYSKNCYLLLNNRNLDSRTYFFNIITLIIIFIGSILEPKILWGLADLFLGIMSIINLYAIIKKKNEVIKEMDDFYDGK